MSEAEAVAESNENLAATSNEIKTPKAKPQVCNSFSFTHSHIQSCIQSFSHQIGSFVYNINE